MDVTEKVGKSYTKNGKTFKYSHVRDIADVYPLLRALQIFEYNSLRMFLKDVIAKHIFQRQLTPWPPRTPRISGLKSQVLKPTFSSKN